MRRREPTTVLPLLLVTVLLATVLLATALTTTTDAAGGDGRCFAGAARPGSCPGDGEQCRCRRTSGDPRSAVCCDVPSSFLLKEGLACLHANGSRAAPSVLRLHVRNATLDRLSIGLVQSHLKTLTDMSVTDGRIGRIDGEFTKHTAIACLNLSGNGLAAVDRRLFVHLNGLRTLDLSHNKLSEVPNFNKVRVIALDISDNGPLMCRSLMDAMKNTELHFLHGNRTFCLFPKTFNWFNTTELVPLVQVETYNELEKKSCSDNCTCKAQRLDIVPGRPPTFAVMVDCSGKQLTEMPTHLPPNTIALNISNNNISALRIDHVIYENIRELDADNNQITSILSLEGTKFIDNFVALSLRNNRLRTLPTYMLSNIFDRNYVSRNVHLGLNRLHCDCSTARILRVWLLTKQKYIPDFGDILCENFPLKVVQLDQAKICQHADRQDWTDYIYYIIGGEVLLLVCLVLKVSYDYWVFKTAGYLPWPASKMPKLPCDWLCE